MSSLWVDVQKTALNVATDPHAAFHVARRGLGLLRARVVLRSCELGARVSVMGPVEIENRGRVVIDHHAYFLPGMMPTRLKIHPGAELHIGANCGFNFAATVEVFEKITFGQNCMIASMVTFRDAPGKPITIGDNVWLAHAAAIEAGVTVGEGSVISAGTRVTRDVPADHLAIGEPARNVRLDTLSRGR